MTARERATASMSFQMGDTVYHMKGRLREAQIDAIEAAITAAVEEEREACAQLRKSNAIWQGRYEELGENIAREVQKEREACAKIAESYVKIIRMIPIDSNWIAEEIRARSTT